MRKVSILLLLATIFVSSCLSSTKETSGQVVHHVLFWLKNPDSSADKVLLMEGLNTLREIPEVKELMIGTPASTLEREVVDSSFDVSELMLFESIAAQDAYQVHPLHQKFIEQYGHLWDRVIVYDVVVN